MAFEIVRVGHEHCLALRQQVLWPDFPIEHSYVPGDEHATHYAVITGPLMVCCLSVFDLGKGLYQIRKFATSADYQGKGHGTALLTHAIGVTQRIGATAITLSARESAIGFYERFGFSARGERFQRHDVRYVNMLLEFASQAA